MAEGKTDPEKEGDKSEAEPRDGAEPAAENVSKGSSDADPNEDGTPSSQRNESSQGDSAQPEPDSHSGDAASGDAASGDAASGDAGNSGAGSSDAASSAEGKPAEGKKEDPETWTNTILWVLAIVAVLGIELFIYGHNGFIRVCVGVDTLTNYSLKHEPRTRENAKNHPFCAEKLNLGMWTSSDELAKQSLQEACTMAARVVGQEHKERCLRKDEPWTREVEMQQVMPWDPRLYRRLLFLE